MLAEGDGVGLELDFGCGAEARVDAGMGDVDAAIEAAEGKGGHIGDAEGGVAAVEPQHRGPSERDDARALGEADEVWGGGGEDWFGDEREG